MKQTPPAASTQSASQPARKRTVLLTGATGQVGSYLLKILLDNGHRVFCLSRGNANASARRRVEELLSFWDASDLPRHLAHLAVMEGDITQPGLGLSATDANLLRTETAEIFHSAAVTDIGRPLDEIRAVNVEGTRHVLDFGLTCPHLERVNHISTAYVCGKHAGDFSEDDLDVGQSFNTTYEQSKFEAEKLVHTYGDKLPVDIFRPAVVVGESSTGKINEFRNIYQFLNLCRLELFDKLPVKGGMISIVCVDDCCRAMYTIAQAETPENRTYNIFPPESVPLETIIAGSSRLLGFAMPALVAPGAFDIRQLTSAQRQILEKNILKLNTRVRLQSRKTSNLLKKLRFNYAPNDGKTLNNLLTFFKLGK